MRFEGRSASGLAGNSPAARRGSARATCLRTRIDRELTRPMVGLSLLFLGLMTLALPHSFVLLPEDAAAVVTRGEAANEAAPGAGVEGAGDPSAGELTPFERATLLHYLAVASLALLATFFWIELAVRLAFVERGEHAPSRGRLLYMLCCALVPPLRTGLAPATMRGFMWLPVFGWRRTSGILARRVQRTFGIPMLAIGLLILPVLLGEIFLREQAMAHAGLRFGLDTATRLIWFAFALEFMVMMAVTPRKMEYAFRHWVDMVIILLPFVAFLRTLQVLRAGQILRAQRMSQLARTYRLRGVVIKLLQALLMLRVLEGMSDRAARRRIQSIREQIDRRHGEIAELHVELRQVRSGLAQRLRKQRQAQRQPAAKPQVPFPGAPSEIAEATVEPT